MPSATPDVVVVGAGVVGMACALELGRRGARVVVVDRETSATAARTATPAG